MPMTLRNRITRLEERAPSHFRVFFESEAESALIKHPKRPGDVVIVIPDSALDL